MTLLVHVRVKAKVYTNAQVYAKRQVLTVK